MKKYSFIMAIFLATGIAAAAYASILFTGILTVSNSGTAASEVCTTFSINASYLQDVYGVDDEFDYVKILNSSGENVTFQPGYGTNPWCIFIPEIGEYTNADYEFYTGNASLDGKKAIFLNDSMTITDDASMECGDNFTMTFDDYYISGNRTWASKTNAYSLTTASGNITFSVTGGPTLTAPISDGEHNIEVQTHGDMGIVTQDTGPVSIALGIGGVSRAGQCFDPTYPIKINSVQYSLKKIGSPTGTGYARLRDSSNDSILGTIGTVDVSTLTTSAQWITFDTTPVSSGNSTTVYLSFEYSSGTGNVAVYYNNTGDTIDGNFFTYYGSAYHQYADTNDLKVRYSYQENGIVFTIDGNDIDIIEWTFGSDSIPDTVNDLVIYAPYYLGGYNLSVNGTDVCSIPWSYGATLEDQSGNGNDATPTFRTTSSDADVSAELTEYLPYQEADADTVPIGYGTIFDEAPEQPETAYSENTSPGIFFAPALNAIIDITPIPRSFFWYNFAFCIIILSGMVTWRIHQSLILKAIVMTAFMILFALPGINIYGMYTVIYFSFFNFGLIVMSRSYGL